MAPANTLANSVNGFLRLRGTSMIRLLESSHFLAVTIGHFRAA